MIAKITRGKNPGDIGAYLHGPGKANEHVYEFGGSKHSGGIVIASNIGMEGHLDPSQWAGELRKAINTRQEIKNPVWHVSLRNTAQDRTLSDATWADIGQSFAEDMGFDGHPWVMVRHGHDHVHLVVSRVGDTGEVWHARNDRRAAQSACMKLEREHGLEQAPRRRVQPKLAVTAEREEFKDKARSLGSDRAAKEAERRALEEHRERMRRLHLADFPKSPTTRAPVKGITPVARPYTPPQPGRDAGYER
ncbi:relaxase/mobilization nuclease domain-containing protein [Neomicrococcus lactis]